MPYRCVHCSRLYEDGSKEVLTGCLNCGRRFFFYIRKEKLELLKNKDNAEDGKYGIELTDEEKKQIEEDVRDIAGIKDEEAPVFLDFESVRVLKEGKYLIDLTKLFAENLPKIYQLEDGKYIVDLTSPIKKEYKEFRKD